MRSMEAKIEMGDDIEELSRRIKLARAYAVQVVQTRAKMAAVLSGASFTIDHEVEFPEPDTMYVYRCMFGHRLGEPTMYRLSFEQQLKWVGVSHPWGLKPADIVVDEV